MPGFVGWVERSKTQPTKKWRRYWVVQGVFRALGRKVKGKESYMQPDAGNTTAICVSVAHRTTSWKQATRSVS